MPPIPKFEQQKLASSITGTPGADTSAVDVANTFKGVADTSLQVGGKIAIEKKQIQDAALANKASVDYDVALEKEWITHQASYKMDPTGKTDFLKEKGQTILDDMASGIESPDARAKFQKDGYARLGQKLMTEAEWANKQSIQNTIDATTSAEETAANEAYIAGTNQDFGRVNELLTASTQRLASVKSVMGDKDAKNLAKMTPKAVLSGLLDSNPAMVKQILDNEGDTAFKKTLDPEEIDKFKKDAVSAFEKQTETNETKYLISKSTEFKAQIDAVHDGSATYATIQSIDDPKVAKSLNNLRLKAKPYTPSDKQSTFMNRYEELRNMIKGTGNNARSTVKLEELIAFQRQVIDDETEGRIDVAQSASLLKPLAVPISKEYKEAGQWWGAFYGATEPYKRAYDGVVADGKKFGLKQSVQTDVLVEFDRQLTMLGDNPSVAEIDGAYQTAYSETMRRVNPALLKSSEVPNATGKKGEMVQPIYSGPVTSKADVKITPPAPQKKNTDITPKNLKFTADKHGITVDELKKRLGVSDNA